MSRVCGAVIELTGGNVRNDHFYLRGLPWLPSEVIGGSSEAEAAAQVLVVTFDPGPRVETDVAGDKMILRARAPVGEFFKKINATEGTRIVVELTGPRELRVAKLR